MGRQRLAAPPTAAGAARRIAADSWAPRALFVLATVFALREARAEQAPVVVANVLTFVLAPKNLRWCRRHGVSDVLIALRNLAQRTRRLRLIRGYLQGERSRPPSLRSWLRLPPRPMHGRRTQPPQLSDAQAPPRAVDAGRTRHDQASAMAWPGVGDPQLRGGTQLRLRLSLHLGRSASRVATAKPVEAPDTTAAAVRRRS